jgi:glycosyltransferase involved in cell wall biosynthesis
MKPLILFITRNYPPKVGGLENYSYHLIRQFEKSCTVFKITSSRSRAHLFWFLPFCLVTAVRLCRRHPIRRIHLCDGLLSPIGLMLRVATRTPVSITVHGLDVTCRFPVYQRLIPSCLRRLDPIVCVSRSTREACLQRGIPAAKCHVIPNGMDPEVLQLPADHEALLGEIQDHCGFSFNGKKILLTVGRLVPRKGIAWFVREVMPQMPPDVVYLIAGKGPEFSLIDRTTRDLGLKGRVSLLGRISDGQRNALLARADICVMPNVSTPGDMEGFGISAIEAGAAGVPVVASNLEGIRDAVIDGVTGYLVAEKDPKAFRDKIIGMDLDRQNIRATVRSTFNWVAIAGRYRDLLLHAAKAGSDDVK